MVQRIAWYFISFVAVWFGAGLIIQSIDRIARKLKFSSFALSFFILGLLTSIPETAVSIGAVTRHDPEIFVGTLLGGTLVIFLLIIPVLAIVGRGVRISHNMDTTTILGALGVIAAPGLLVTDNRVTNVEGFLLIVLYVALFYSIQKKHGVLDRGQTEALTLKKYSFLDIAKVILGVSMVFVSSRYIVNQTIVFSELLHIPTFYISLIVLSLGANLPELSLAIRAIVSGKKDIAFGDYLGSAAGNTLLFGVFTIINDGEVLTVNNFMMTFLFIAVGLGFFYHFSKSQRDISIVEGTILLCMYLLFIVYEVGKGLVIIE